MIRPEQITDEVVEAAGKAAHDEWRRQASVGDDICEYPQWDDISRFCKDDLRIQARAAIAAALNAWPGAWYDKWDDAFILPLPQPPRDE